MHTPIEKIQAGPADPQSSSDQLPEAMSGKTRTIGVPRSPIISNRLALFNAMFMPPLTGLIASEGALTPASFPAGAAACPLLTRSVHGVQWSTTSSLAGTPPEEGVYFSLRSDSPH